MSLSLSSLSCNRSYFLNSNREEEEESGEEKFFKQHSYFLHSIIFKHSAKRLKSYVAAEIVFIEKNRKWNFCFICFIYFKFKYTMQRIDARCINNYYSVLN